jgi:hypothetical protein
MPKPKRPDIEFVVLLQAHSVAGRKWLQENVICKDDMWSGVVVRPSTARYLGDQAVADGLWISGWSNLSTYEWEPLFTEREPDAETW